MRSAARRPRRPLPDLGGHPRHRRCGTVGPMPSYERFARFYDAAMDDPGPRAERVLGFIDRYRPGATTLLELGCGTGSILARLHSVPTLTGLDRSPEMLAVARGKVPGARLIEGDMSSFSLGERFDVVVCVFDTLNHLLDFGAWQSVFAALPTIWSTEASSCWTSTRWAS